MPMYEYECGDCGNRFELIQKFSDEPVSTCPSCGGKVRKLVSSSAIQFKGTGWYVTDYARKPRPEQSEGKEKSSKDEKPTKSDTKGKDKSSSGAKPASSDSSSKPAPSSSAK